MTEADSREGRVPAQGLNAASTPGTGTRLERPALRSPRSAAYAGIIFSLLVLISLVAIRLALPKKPADSADLLTSSPKREILLGGLSLIPFASVAFLWFIGVIRERIGEREDRFFATVFLGSGLLFAGMLLMTEAMAAGMVVSVEPSVQTFSVTAPDWWTTTRNVCDEMLEAALQMAGVFTTATSVLLLRTGVAPRWLGVTGAVLSVLLIVAVFFTKWIGLLFPLWVFVLSLSILRTARQDEADAGL
jgi:hypothetical protein